MDRRTFILGLLAVAAGSSATLVAAEAAATPSAQASCSLPAEAAVEEGSTAAPDGLPVEYSQYHRRSTHRHHRHRRRQVCRVHRDRWGRRVRRCHWV